MTPSAPSLRRALALTTAASAEARQLPGAAFSSAAFFALERRLFSSSWLPVCHASELTLPGAFVAFDLLGERVLVVRGADLEVRAFFDRCLHRGTPLTTDPAGRIERLELVCPYHGLHYDLRGRALEPAATRLCLSRGELDAAQVEERFGFLFVRLARAAGHLAAEPSPPWLERAGMHTLRLARRQRHVVAANWKLLVENFQESHHFPLVHPSLERRTPFSASSSEAFGGRFLGGTMELLEGCETVSESGKLEGRPFVAADPDRRCVRDACLFPGWLTSLQPDYFLSYRIMPEAPDRTTVVSEIFFHAEAPEAAHADVLAFWDRTNAEDRAICERQQRGVTSPSYEPGPYAPSEDGMHAFDRLVAEAYLELLEAP